MTKPSRKITDPKELLLDYLDYFRSAIVRKLDGLPESELRTSRLPSGWTPLELVNHLVYMERRWLRWGFTGEQVDAPWGDADENDRWAVPLEVTTAELIAAVREGGARTRAIAAAADLGDLASTGGRFTTDAERPTLAWILFHVLEEYARHAGHLDIARELADGQTGE